MARVFKHVDWVIKWSSIDIFEFWDLWLDVDNLKYLEKNDLPSVNQYKYTKTKSACTIVWALIQASILYDVDITETDMLDCVIFANKEMRYQFGRGWWADLWMRALEKRWENKFPDKKLYYSTIRRDSPEFSKLLKKGYPLWFTYWGNYQYSKDYQSDNILDWSKFWTATYRHRTTMLQRDNKVIVCDSSWGNRYNTYELKDLNWLFQNWVFGEMLFVFTKEANIDNTKELSRLIKMRNLVKVVNYNSNKLLWLTNDPMYQNQIREMLIVNDEKLRDIDEVRKNLDSTLT